MDKAHSKDPSPLEGESPTRHSRYGDGAGMGEGELQRSTPHPHPPPQGGRGLALLFVLAFYAAVSLWRMHVSPFPTHGDGCWYDMVARNVARGHGLVEDCVWHYAIRPATLSHPIGNYWNPLCPLIVGGFYKLLGVSKTVGQLAPFLMDGLLCAAIFFFCLRRMGSLWIAAFSSLIFTVHRFLLTFRGGGGVPESVLMFFVTLGTYSLIHAWEGRRLHYLAAAFWGGLAYLARNEGGMSLLAILFIYGYQEFGGKRWAGWKGPWQAAAFLLAVVGVFTAVVLPWEIRNHLLYGSAANAAKYNFLLARTYDDIWSYSQTFSLDRYWELGWMKILAIKLTSYYYKLDLFFETTSWPLAIFLPLGLLVPRGSSWKAPLLIYFMTTYTVMGFLNSVSQSGGWNGISVFLPFFIPMAVSGVFAFAEGAWPSPAAAASASVGWKPPGRALPLAFLLCSGIFLYHLAENARFVHRYRKSGGDPKAVTMKAVGDWFQAHPQPRPPVALTHFAYELTYYTGIPAVKIPTYDPRPILWEVAQKYGCTHLVLIGDNDVEVGRIYQGIERDNHLELLASIPYRVPLENGGDQIQIYRLRFAT